MGKVKSADLQNRAKGSGTRAIVRGAHVLQALALALLVLNCLLIYAILLSSKGVLGYREQCRQVAALDAKVEKLKEENHRVFRKIRAFKEDARAQERLVREKLGWVRQDELVIEFVPTNDVPSHSADSRDP